MTSKGTNQKSPCVDICQIDGRTRWCVGCGRTVDEIKKLAKMTPYRQSAVFAELKRRVALMETQRCANENKSKNGTGGEI